MVDLTRRGFLRSASISAAAIGVLGAVPTLAQAQQQGAGPAIPGPAAVPSSPVPMLLPTGAEPAVSTPLVVYIDNPASGKGIIFVGEQGISFENPALVQTLQSAVA